MHDVTMNIIESADTSYLSFAPYHTENVCFLFFEKTTKHEFIFIARRLNDRMSRVDIVYNFFSRMQTVAHTHAYFYLSIESI